MNNITLYSNEVKEYIELLSDGTFIMTNAQEEFHIFVITGKYQLQIDNSSGELILTDVICEEWSIEKSVKTPDIEVYIFNFTVENDDKWIFHTQPVLHIMYDRSEDDTYSDEDQNKPIAFIRKEQL